MLTTSEVDAKLARDGAIACVGQIYRRDRARLNRLAEQGVLVRYRGHWDTLRPGFGVGSLKMIWATPEFALSVGAAEGDGIGDTIEGMMLRRQRDVSARQVAA